MCPVEKRVQTLVGTLETQRQLGAFAAANSAISFAVVAAEDGIELAAYPPRCPTTGRLAAMSSSLHALSETLLREARLVDGRSLIVEADGGVVIVLQVPDTKPRVSLAVVASGSGILGQLLWASRNCCASLKGTLQVG